MFLVFNKDKLISFLVATCTVIVLFMMTSLFAKTPEKVVETSTDIEKNTYNENNTIDNSLKQNE